MKHQLLKMCAPEPICGKSDRMCPTLPDSHKCPTTEIHGLVNVPTLTRAGVVTIKLVKTATHPPQKSKFDSHGTILEM